MKNKKKKIKLNKRRIIVLIILALILFLIIFGIIKLITKFILPEKVVGNYANMGLALADGNTIYYNKYEKGIFKVEKNEETQLTEETAYSITLDGDRIYYLTVSSENTIDLNSVKTNGEDLKKIKTLATSISKFYLKDGFIYYVSDKESIGLNKLSIESGEESTLTVANIRDFVLDDDIIYFTDNVGFLHSIAIDGTDLKDISTEYNIKNIQILKNWIYFYDENENALCKIKKNGSSKTTVATFVNNETYNVTSKGVYYFDAVNKQICRCDLKGKKSKSIVSLNTSRTHINIVDGMIYYLDNSQDTSQIHQIYRIKENGKESIPIEY